MPAVTSLFGRESETQVLAELIAHLPDRGGSLVVSGEPGVGKSALLREASTRAQDRGMLVLTATGVQCEAELPFAGLHQLLQPVLGQIDGLAAPQRGAMLAAFGLNGAVAPDLFRTALAVLDLLAETAARAPVVVVLEDAHWLDRSTCEVLAFVARRLEFEPILLFAVIRDGYESPFTDAGLRALHLEPLPAAAAEALLDSRAPGLPDAVRDRLLDETAGNPLALVELPIAFRHLETGARLPAWLPLTTRLERAFAARVSDLPAVTRTALLLAALNDKPRITEVLGATALLAGAEVTVDALIPAVAARLVELDDPEYRFRHPLMRTAIPQDASVSQRHAAHAALADVLVGEPERGLWHRAASMVGPDERVARELETAAAQAQRRGATVMAVSALHRAAALSDAPLRAARLLRAAELAFELGRQTLSSACWDKSNRSIWGSGSRRGWRGSRRASQTASPEMPRGCARSAATADRAGADGDSDIALNLLYGAALRCWWAEPGQAARAHVVTAAERLDVDEQDPRLLVILAFAAPIGRGATVIDRLSQLEPDLGGDPGATRLIGNAAMAVGAFDKAAGVARGLGHRTARPGPAAGTSASRLQAWSAAARRPGHGDPSRRGGTPARTGDEPAAGHGNGSGGPGAAGRLARRPGGGRRRSPPRPSGCRVPIRRLERRAGRGAARPWPRGSGRRPPRRTLSGTCGVSRTPADPAYHAADQVRHRRRSWPTPPAAAATRKASGSSVDQMETAAAQTPSPLPHAGLRYARALLAKDGRRRRAVRDRAASQT